jgi:hypothetical protein
VVRGAGEALARDGASLRLRLVVAAPEAVRAAAALGRLARQSPREGVAVRLVDGRGEAGGVSPARSAAEEAPGRRPRPLP